MNLSIFGVRETGYSRQNITLLEEQSLDCQSKQERAVGEGKNIYKLINGSGQ